MQEGEGDAAAELIPDQVEQVELAALMVAGAVLVGTEHRGALADQDRKASSS